MMTVLLKDASILVMGSMIFAFSLFLAFDHSKILSFWFHEISLPIPEKLVADIYLGKYVYDMINIFETN